MDIRENSLERHGKGCDLRVLQLYLPPSALGAAQDDRVRWFCQGRLLLLNDGFAWDAPGVANFPRHEAGNELNHGCPTKSNTAAIAFVRLAPGKRRKLRSSTQPL